jgi:hypothetical protein
LNQDSFWPEPSVKGDIVYPLEEYVPVSRGYLFVVAHGSGMPPYGLEACKLGIQTLVGEFYNQASSAYVPPRLQEAFQAANEAVYDYTKLRLEERVAGNSMIAAVIQEGELTLANIGATSAYLIRESHVEELAPLEKPPRPGGFPWFPPIWLLGERTPLVVRASAKDPVPARPYLDIVSGRKIKAGEVLILTSDYGAGPRSITEEELHNTAKHISDGTIARRLAEAAWKSTGMQMTVTVLAVWLA